MELTPQQRKRLEKLAKFAEDNEIATVDSFVELEEKIEEVKEAVDEKLSSIQEELKKKLESELVLEIDREELRGEDGEDGLDGEDYILTEQDLEDIAKKVKVPVVEKVIEKTEVIRETPIITNEIKEVALTDTAEDIRNKLELLEGNERLEFKAIKQSEEILKDIKELKARPVQWESGRGTGGGNLEVFEEGTKRGSGAAINFGAGFDITHDGHTATVNLDAPSGGGTWGTITGDVTDQTDLTTYLSSNYVPYTGATNNVDLGTNSITAGAFKIKESGQEIIVIDGLYSALGNAIHIGDAKTGSSDGTTSYGSLQIGPSAGYLSTSAYKTLMIGANAGESAKRCFESIFIGTYAGYNTTDLTSGLCIGTYAGSLSSGNSGITAIGVRAGSNGGFQNSVMIGYQAGRFGYNDNGVVIGYNAGYLSTSVSHSIMIGYQAGSLATQSKYSVFIGASVGVSASSTGYSVAVGYLSTPSSYNNTVAIGTRATNTASNQANIGNALYIENINTATSTSSTTSYGKIGGAWEVNDGYYISTLTQSGYSIYDRRTGTHLAIPTNSTCIVDFDVIITTDSGVVDAFKISGLCQNVAGTLMPIGKLRAMSDTGITSYEWFVGGSGGDLIPALGTWYESGTSTLKFDIVGGSIRITSTELNTAICGSVKITKTSASSGGYYY